jgi:hypothetical protein
MDTGILARVLDDVLEYGGDYRIDSLDLGRKHEDESRALVEITADDGELLERIVMRLQTHGANAVDPGTATTRPAWSSAPCRSATCWRARRSSVAPTVSASRCRPPSPAARRRSSGS